MMLNATRVGVQSARSAAAATAAGAPSRAATPPLARGVANLARRSPPHGARGVAVPRSIHRAPRAPFRLSGAAAHRGAGSAAAGGGGDKDGSDSSDSDSDSDDDDDDDDEDNNDEGGRGDGGDGDQQGRDGIGRDQQGRGGDGGGGDQQGGGDGNYAGGGGGEGATGQQEAGVVGADKAGGKGGGKSAAGALGGGGGGVGERQRTLEEEAEALGIVFRDGGGGRAGHGGGGQDGGAQADGSERGDYREVGSEVYEGGDVEAGETLRGMYDFVDDIVETQHVPTIRDPFDARGKFHRCRGKKQGKAALEGTCEIFNAKELHINNVPLLKRFVNDAGMILGRSRSGLCAKCQRKVSKTVKSARQMGLVPTISMYRIRDTGPGGLYAWAGEGGNHDAQAKAKALAEAALRKNEKKSFGSLL